MILLKSVLIYVKQGKQHEKKKYKLSLNIPRGFTPTGEYGAVSNGHAYLIKGRAKIWNEKDPSQEDYILLYKIVLQLKDLQIGDKAWIKKLNVTIVIAEGNLIVVYSGHNDIPTGSIITNTDHAVELV